MATRKGVPTCALPPSIAWRRLVDRSISAWDKGPLHKPAEQQRQEKQSLQAYNSLEDLLLGGPNTMMFWFFQTREAFLTQTEMTRWSRDKLEEYILLPATLGSVSRLDCFFVSHFWFSKDQPDYGGQLLRRFQEDLKGQEWSYVWLDWTCAPQAPRNPTEADFFARTMTTVPSIIRNAGFSWFYPPFEARLWILYEVAEYHLTSSHRLNTQDIQQFVRHVDEMVQHGVRHVLEKYNYRCTYEQDEAFITPLLELLVLLKRLDVDIDDARQLLDNITWFPTTKSLVVRTEKSGLKLDKSKGSLLYQNKKYTFTPFPISYTTPRPGEA